MILFGIALIAAVIGAFALSGKGATKSTSSEEAKLAASTLLKQAGDLQEAIQRYRSDRGGFNGMSFSTDANTGLFNTTDRFATQLVGPPKGYVNNLIYGAQFPITTAIQASSQTEAVWLDTTSTIALTFVDPPTLGIPKNATEGCVSTTTSTVNPDTGASETTHAYFKVVNEGGAI